VFLQSMIFHRQAGLRRAKRKIARAGQELGRWVKFRPGTPPRHAVRQIVLAMATFVISRPHYAAVIRRLVAPFPFLKSRLRPAVLYAAHDLATRRFSNDRLDMNSEPESVQETYRRLIETRKRLLAAD